MEKYRSIFFIQLSEFHQIASLLGLSIKEADELLKKHGIEPVRYSRFLSPLVPVDAVLYLPGINEEIIKAHFSSSRPREEAEFTISYLLSSLKQK